MYKIKILFVLLFISCYLNASDPCLSQCEEARDCDVTLKSELKDNYDFSSPLIRKDIHIGTTHLNAKDDNKNSCQVGIGSNIVVDSTIYLGVVVDFDYSTVNGDSSYFISGGFKPGYVINKTTAAYAILDLGYNYGANYDGPSLGLGVGVEYLITPKVATDLEFKHNGLSLTVKYLF
jgi:hypothetical protein